MAKTVWTQKGWYNQKPIWVRQVGRLEVEVYHSVTQDWFVNIVLKGKCKVDWFVNYSTVESAKAAGMRLAAKLGGLR